MTSQRSSSESKLLIGPREKTHNLIGQKIGASILAQFLTDFFHLFVNISTTKNDLGLLFFADSEAPTRNIDFSPFRRAYRGGGHGSPATRSVQSEVSPLRSFRNFQHNQNQQRLFATPPAPRRGVLPSPKGSKPSWVQRHLRRRPQTVNVDDATLSGKIVAS